MARRCMPLIAGSAMARGSHVPRCRLALADSTVMQKPTAPVRTSVRDGIHEEARQTMAMLRNHAQTVNVVLVALTDGIELEVWADGELRRRSRYLRDTEARKYVERLAGRLERRGYR